MDTAFELPKDLIELIKTGRCVLFVGAGLSHRVKRANGKRLPLWKGLLEEFLEWLLQKKIALKDNIEDIRKEIESKMNDDVAQSLRDCVTTEQFGDFIKDVFGDETLESSKLHMMITYFKFRAILTTNYDNLLEKTYRNKGLRDLEVLTFDTIEEQSEVIQKGGFFLFKIHGDYNKPETLVFSKKEYRRITHQSQKYSKLLDSLFLTNTVLFIGFSLDDPALRFIFDGIFGTYPDLQHKYYALFSAGEISGIQKRRLSEDNNIEVIEYPKDANHTQLETLVKHIFEKAHPTEQTTSYKIGTGNFRILIAGMYKDTEILKQFADKLPISEYEIEVFAISKDCHQGTLIDIFKRIEKTDIYIPIYTDNSWESYELRTLNTYSRAREEDKDLLSIAILISDDQNKEMSIPGYFYSFFDFRNSKDFINSVRKVEEKIYHELCERRRLL